MFRSSLLYFRYLFAMAACICLSAEKVQSRESEPIRVALAFNDASAGDKQWDHLRSLQDSALIILSEAVLSSFGSIDRTHVVVEPATLSSRGRSTFKELDDIEFALHFIVRKLDKLFRNRTVYDPYNSGGNYSIEASSQREIVALPALSAAIEVRLIRLRNDKVMWSTLQDSTLLVPNGNRFVYNAEKYPGFTHPEVIRDYIAPILRQRQRRPSALRMLSVADRWYLSQPVDDAREARALLQGLVRDLMPEVDARIPLYGSIVSLEGNDKKKRPLFQLDIGAQQGIVKKLRLDVFKAGNTAKKVGQVEIVSVDSSSSIARLHKLDRAIRKQGGMFAAGDRVFSRKRPPQFAKRNIP